MEKIAFIFPGQGSQYAGMAQSCYARYEAARHTFEEANDRLGFDLAKLCFEGSLADLGRTENALVALLTVSVVYFRVYMQEIGVTPQFCAGHSLGEYSALTCSGVLKFGDAVQLVYSRSKIAREVAESINGAMTIIDGLPAAVVAEQCLAVDGVDHSVAVSCFNSPVQVAISGHLEAVQQVEDRVLELGGQVTPLMGNPPFHCPALLPAAERFTGELSRYSFDPPRYPVIANVSALPYDGPESVAANLTHHIIRPVQWLKTMDYLNRHRITLAVELGPKNVLSDLLKLNYEAIHSISFDQKEERRALAESFRSNPLYRNYIPSFAEKCLTIAATAPNFNFGRPDDYQTGVLGPYRALRQIREETDGKGAPPSEEQMRAALELLCLILTTKKTPLADQQQWLAELFEETGTTQGMTGRVEIGGRSETEGGSGL
jgi:[acyl-carrier-protein] S-malonyltransferase